MQRITMITDIMFQIYIEICDYLYYPFLINKLVKKSCFLICGILIMYLSNEIEKFIKCEIDRFAS